MTRQEEILLEVAKRHGLTIGAARHAFYCIGKTAAEIMDDPSTKNEDGTWNLDNLKTVGIQGLGKLVPYEKMIKARNYKILEKNELRK
jgi:hypothetical protein